MNKSVVIVGASGHGSPMIQKYGENGQRVLENYEKLIEFILSETDCTITKTGNSLYVMMDQVMGH